MLTVVSWGLEHLAELWELAEELPILLVPAPEALKVQFSHRRVQVLELEPLD
jgi:hypothetical protein